MGALTACVAVTGLLCLAPIQDAPGWRETAALSFAIDGPMNSGTAFPVATLELPDGSWRTLFLTAGHVAMISPSGLKLKQVPGDDLGDVELYLAHPTSDAALMVVDLPSEPELVELRFDPLEEGETVYHSGYGGAHIERWITRGIAAGPNRGTTSIAPGDSGAPVIDERGRVAAVVVGVARLPDGVHLILGHSYYVPLADIEGWLKDAIEGLASPQEEPAEKGSSQGSERAEEGD